jgi:hypothetical protein
MRKAALIVLAAAGVTLAALFVGRLAPPSGGGVPPTTLDADDTAEHVTCL